MGGLGRRVNVARGLGLEGAARRRGGIIEHEVLSRSGTRR